LNLKTEYTIPKLIDPDGGPVTLSFYPEELKEFITYENNTRTFTFYPN
jgi:hypothetical protein